MADIPANLKMFTPAVGKTDNKVVNFPGSKETSGPSFKDFLGDARDSLDAAEKVATGKVTGKNEVSIVDAVSQIAEAELKLNFAKTALEKTVGAFKEVNGMNI